MRSLLLLFYINYATSFNLYSVIYPIKQSFNYVDNKWNWNNKLFPYDNKEANYIGKWYYYNNIDFIKTRNDIIADPECWNNNIVLTNYICKNNKIKSSKIISDNVKLPPYYIKNKRYFDNYKEYYKNEHLYSNRIIKLKHTRSYDELNKYADILRTLVVRPNHCSVTCSPHIPKNDIVNKLFDKNNINNTNYTISFNIWLTDKYNYNNDIRTGMYISYDGINGNLKEFILKKENMINNSININNKINLSNLYELYNLEKINYTTDTDIDNFDNNTTINYIILKNNWEGNYRIQNILNNTYYNQLTWSADHGYFIPISNNDIDKYYQLKFKNGIYINIPKNLNDFQDKDKIYIEFVCFFKNASGIQRFLAWGSKNDGGIKTFCHDIWNKHNLNLLN